MTNEQERLEMAFLICLRKLRKSSISAIFDSLSTAEFFTLTSIRTLKHEQQSNVRVSALAERLDTSPQAISKMLRSLEGKGYIKRVTDPANRRNTFVLITEEGDTLLQNAQASIAQFAQLVTQKMGEEDMANFIRLGEKCSQMMNEAATELYGEKEELS